MKKTATPFHQGMPVCIKHIMASKSSSAVVCCFQVSLTIKWKKILKQINGRHIQGFSSGKYRVQQVSARILDRAGGFVEAISFLANKKLPHCCTHQLYVCLFLSEDSAFGF